MSKNNINLAQTIFDSTCEGILEQKNFLDLVLTNIADGVYSVDRNIIVKSWNKGAERITGHKAEDVIGRPCKEFLIHTDEEGNVLCDTTGCPLSFVIKTEDIVAQKFVFGKTGHAKYIPLEVSAAPLIDEDNKIVGAVETFRDVSTALELKKIRENLTHMLVHDMRNPLTVISSVLQLVLNDNEKVNPRFARLAYESCSDLDEMLMNILEIGKIEQGDFEFKKENFSIDEVIRESVEKFKIVGASKIENFIVDIDEALPNIIGDRHITSRVLANLLTNAIKYTHPKGRVFVNARYLKEDGKILIEVADTGQGIPDRLKERIFDKFWQGKVDDSTERKGVGLGLAFCKLAIEAHGGKIWVENKEGKGSSFKFTVPCSI